MYNGPVWTWLAGQFVYALTRYDRQDFSYGLTDRMVRQVLERDMVGSLPSMFEVSSGADDEWPRAAGQRASLTGMAEFVRSVYQDYLGIRIDGPSHLISFQPKLPAHITDVDFTVFAGRHPITGFYQRSKEASRFTVRAADIPRADEASIRLDDGRQQRLARLDGPSAEYHSACDLRTGRDHCVPG